MSEELQEAERQLSVSEGRFAALTKAVGQIVWTMPPDGAVDDMPLWRAFTGQNTAAVTGWGWLDALHSDDQDHARLLWQEAVAHQHLFEAEYRVRRADGHFRIMLTRIVPVFAARGVLQEWVGSATDITERKQLELRTQQALAAVLQMAEAIVTPSEDLPIAAAVPEAEPAWQATRGVAKRVAELTCHLLGCQRVGIAACDTELRAYPIVAVGLTPADEARWLGHQGAFLVSQLNQSLLARLRQGEVIVADIAPTTQQDRSGWGDYAVLIAPVMLGDGLTGLIALDYGGAAHDYTAEEIALSQTIARLVALVMERDRLVREREAAQSKVLALQELNQRMDEFLGIVSHELRTPLTAMKASIQLSERRIQSLLKAGDALPEAHLKKLEQTYDMLDRSDRQTNRLTRLIGELLDSSRIQQGKIEFHFSPCDINAVVQGVVAEQQQAWPARALTLTPLEQAALGRSLVADVERIEQAVTQLIVNAVKYSPADAPVAIVIRLDHDHVRVSVRDHGPGIPPSEREKIWERFYRMPGTQELNGGGIGFGLGLFICQTIIARHGGDVGVESAPGEGATFWFTLPLALA